MSQSREVVQNKPAQQKLGSMFGESFGERFLYMKKFA
jgi:hypothetical protein